MTFFFHHKVGPVLVPLSLFSFFLFGLEPSTKQSSPRLPSRPFTLPPSNSSRSNLPHRLGPRRTLQPATTQLRSFLCGIWAVLPPLPLQDRAHLSANLSSLVLLDLKEHTESDKGHTLELSHSFPQQIHQRIGRAVEPSPPCAATRRRSHPGAKPRA